MTSSTTTRTNLYVGCYTTTSPVGIWVHEVAGDGTIGAGSSPTGVDDASFLAVHPTAGRLYAVSESVDHGSVVAFAVDPFDGSLTEIDRAASRGGAPCHLAVDPTGRHLVVANYASGNVVALGLTPDGRFTGDVAQARHRGRGPHPRQDGPHAHCVVPDPSGRWVHAADLGTDLIVQYELASTGPVLRRVGEAATAPGSGPRHVAFHPIEPVAFAVCELDCTLVTFEVAPRTGALTHRTTVSTLPGDVAADVAADSLAAAVLVHPAGHRIYVSTRGHDTIAAFEFVDVDTPPLLLGHVDSGGRAPRHITIHPSGRTMLVANQDSDTVIEFDLDTDTGVPRQCGVVARASRPACLLYTTGGS